MYPLFYFGMLNTLNRVFSYYNGTSFVHKLGLTLANIFQLWLLAMSRYRAF